MAESHCHWLLLFIGVAVLVACLLRWQAGKEDDDDKREKMDMASLYLLIAVGSLSIGGFVWYYLGVSKPHSAFSSPYSYSPFEF